MDGPKLMLILMLIFVDFHWQKIFCLQGGIKITKADLIEKKARDVVTMYYKKIDGIAVLIIHGIEMLILDAPKGKNKQEIDFVIVNYTKQYVLNIEVKRSLLEETQIKNKGKSVIDKATEQSQKIKTILEDWYPHLKGVWRYGSMLYCEEFDPILRSCGNCVDFVAEGPEGNLSGTFLSVRRRGAAPAVLS